MEYVFYAMVVVGVLLAGHRIAAYRHKMLVLMVLSSAPNVVKRMPPGDLASHIQTLSANEYLRSTFVMIPFVAVCAVAVMSAPFYFQMEIPPMVGMIMSAAVGWLFTYTYLKDVNPEWYMASNQLVESIVIDEMTESFYMMQPATSHEKQTPTGSTQSNQQE